MTPDRTLRTVPVVITALLAFLPPAGTLVHGASYYVNDGSTDGDVYCTAAGSVGADGLSPGTPLATVNAVVDAYDLEPGDTVYVDTGTYDVFEAIRLTSAHAGSPTEPVLFQGSTNAGAGGTVFDGGVSGGAPTFDVDGAPYVDFADMNLIRCGEYGFRFAASDTCTVARCSIESGFYAGIRVDIGAGMRFESLRIHDGGCGISAQNLFDSVIVNSRIYDSSRHEDATGDGISINQGFGNEVRNCTVAFNEGHQVSCPESLNFGGDGEITVRDSILAARGEGSRCISMASEDYLGDYNDLFAEDGAVLGFLGAERATLSDWQLATSQDLNSISADPLFVDPTGFDFHLQSRTGHYVGDGAWAADGENSPCLDDGDPATAFSLEPEPNGGRVNLGAYGNTPEASLSGAPRAWVRIVTYDLGEAAWGLIRLEWVHGNTIPGDRVRLEISTDAGETWNAIAEGVPATNTFIPWDSTSVPSTPIALWRVTLERDPSVTDTSLRTFPIRNDPLAYYVNDGFTEGDVYCTAPGSLENHGGSPARPVNSLGRLLTLNDLEPGDTVYVDAGEYLSSQPARIELADGGAAGAPLTIQGPPASSGSTAVLVLDNQERGNRVIDVNRANYIHIRDISTSGGENALWLDRSDGSRVESCAVTGALYAGLYADMCSDLVLEDVRAHDNGGSGIRVDDCGARIAHCVVCDNSDYGIYLVRSDDTVPAVENCTVACNGQHAVAITGVRPRLRNNILVADRPYMACIYEKATNPIDSDYNDLYALNGAVVGSTGDNSADRRATLEDWQAVEGQDLHSLSHDPLFADFEGRDLHLRSLEGRIQPDGTWTADADHSPCIDMGDPSVPVGGETEPNASRVNLGAYGGTDRASRSRTDPWILALTLNGGGNYSGAIPLRWAAGNAQPGETVRLELSPDEGLTWTEIASGIPVGDGEHVWDPAAGVPGSPLALWRAVLETAGVDDAADRISSVHPFVLYANDTYTFDDVYCTVAGDDGNPGTTPDSPKASPKALVDAYDLEGGDTILIDTGNYVLQDALTIGEDDAGSANAYVSLLGSTDRTTGGTRLRRSSASVYADAVHLAEAPYVRLANLSVEAPDTGVTLDASPHAVLENIDVTQVKAGINISGSSHTRATGIRIHDFVWTGIGIGNSTNVHISNSVVCNGYGGVKVGPGAQVGLENVTLAENSSYQLLVYEGQCELQNSILTARGEENQCILWESSWGGYEGSYNCFFADDGALIGRRDWENRETWDAPTLSDWIVATGGDASSLAADPGFADPAGSDFHLRSRAGRYDPSSGARVTDGTDSPCLDRGDPDAPSDAEPLPNGDRVNLGAYGNTAEASMSPDDLPPWIAATAFNAGGNMNGTVDLTWAWGNLPGDTVVRIESSSDDGATWTDVATAIPIADDVFSWDTTTAASSPVTGGGSACKATRRWATPASVRSPCATARRSSSS